MQNKMKAWIVSPKGQYYADVIFAETRNKAKALAKYCDGFEDTEYIDIDIRRVPKADKLYKGQFGLDWYNDEDRIFLVKELGFGCVDYFDADECVDCSAKEYCEEYKDYLRYAESEEIDDV